MATVGSLFINVKARTASFSKKMMGVRSTITRMAKGFGRLAMKVGKFAAILGGIALVAIIAFTVKGLKAVDTMAKLAQNIGASVKSIQVLRHMATLGGVSIEKMDKSMAKMVKNVGETAMGIGTATDALKELGLNATDLERMSPEVMFGVLADEINKLPTAARRASVAYDIMGRAGQELLVTMKDGSAGITAMSEKLESLGVIIGDKQAQMVEKANDAWADIGLVWSALANQLAVEFAPILTTIANRIIEFIKSAGGMGKIAEFIVRAFFYVGASVLDVIRVMEIAWLGYKTVVLQVYSDILLAIALVTQETVRMFHKMQLVGVSSLSKIATAYGWVFKQAQGVLDFIDNPPFIDFRNWDVVLTGLGKGLAAAAEGQSGVVIKSEIAEFIKTMGESLGDQATDSAQELLKRWAEGWSLAKVPDFINDMREAMMGEGFDLGEGGALNIEMTSSQIKGAVDSLQTAIGGFKVEGDGQTRLLQSALNVEEKQLQTSKEILTAITQQGGALQ